MAQEHPFYWLRTSVKFFSEHPVSNTDVQNDSDETSGDPGQVQRDRNKKHVFMDSVEKK